MASTNSYRCSLRSVQTHTGVFHSKNSYRCAVWPVQTRTGVLCDQYKLMYWSRPLTNYGKWHAYENKKYKLIQVCFIVKTHKGVLCDQYKLIQVCFIHRTDSRSVWNIITLNYSCQAIKFFNRINCMINFLNRALIVVLMHILFVTFLPRDDSVKRGLCHHTLSVRLSVTFVDHVKTNKRVNFFSPSGSPTILVFPYQTAWQYSDKNQTNGGLGCRRGRLKSRFSTNIWLCDQ